MLYTIVLNLMYHNYFNIDDLKKNQIKNIHYFDNNKKLYLYELYTNDDIKRNINYESVRHDVISYGSGSGKFITNYNTLKFLALNPDKNMIERVKKEFDDDGIIVSSKSFFNVLCFVENKTKFYILHFDFDFKLNKYADEYLGFEDDDIIITQYILKYIIEVLNEVLKLTKKQLEYIWASKSVGKGTHIYFPDITVDRILHRYIFDKVIEKIKNDKKYTEKLINKIFDSVVCSGSNGLRLFYFINNGNYYFPDAERSTRTFDENPEKHFHLCIINSNLSVCNFNLKVDYNLIYNNNHVLDKKTLKKASEEEAICDLKTLDSDNKKQFVVDLGNALNVSKRVDVYSSWISLVILYLNYSLVDEIIVLSKKSKKYDVKSYDTIMKLKNNIETNVKIRNKTIQIGTLIMWAKEDNLDLTNKIFAKYYLSIKLNINDIEDITKKIFNIKPQFIENEKFISKQANDFFKLKINEYHGLDKQLCLLIQSPTGTGKTTTLNTINDYVIDNWKNYTFISIVTRRSMVACQITAFVTDKIVFNSYLDDEITSLDFFISSLEYLIKINDSYDVIILDEVNSLVNYFYSDTLKNKRADCIAKLIKLINKAKIIVCCDANITDLVFSCFNQTKIDFIFYKNEYLNKQDIPLDIYYSTNYNETNNLYTYCDKFIVESVKAKKSVLILTDSKFVTELLKNYLYSVNKDRDYFRIFNKDEGTLKDLIDINKICVNRCIIANSKILYGIDIQEKYNEMHAVYRCSTGYGIDSFCMIQQISRARQTQKVNMLILDPRAKHYFNVYTSYEENKEIQTQYINGYSVFHDELCKKHSVVNEFGCTTLDSTGKKTFSINSIMTEIHFIKSWYDTLFNNNKIDIVKIIAEKSYGYKIKCIDWTPEVKYNFGYETKINKKEILEISKNIYDGNTDLIPEKYIKCVDNLQEQILLRERYLKDITDTELFKKLSCDPEAFQSHMNKKYLVLSEAEFQLKIIELNNKDVLAIIKSDDLINKINNLFWLEKTLKMKRFNFDDILVNNLQDVKTLLTKNKDKFYDFFKSDISKGKTYKSIINKIENISNLNLLQKFVAECYNSVSDGVIVIKSKRKKINNNIILIFSFLVI